MRALFRRGLAFSFVCLSMFVGLRLFDVWGFALSAAIIAGIGTLIEVRDKRRGR